MKLTTKSEYALLSLIYIARNNSSGFITSEEISVFYEIPKKYLEQIMLLLKQNRFLKAKRGASGGYSLSKSPEEISIAEIVRLMDGALAPTESVSTYFYSKTPLEKETKIITVLKEIRDFTAGILEKTTLKDLI